MTDTDPENMKVLRRERRRGRERANDNRDGLRQKIATELELPREDLVGFRVHEMETLAEELKDTPAPSVGLPYHRKGGHLKRSISHRQLEKPSARLDKVGDPDAFGLDAFLEQVKAEPKRVDEIIAQETERKTLQEEQERADVELALPDPTELLPTRFRAKVVDKRMKPTQRKGGRDD